MSTSVQEKHRVLWVLWDSSPHSVFLLWINNLHSVTGVQDYGFSSGKTQSFLLSFSVFPFLAFCQRIFLLCKEMQTFPKDFDHYVEYTKKRMWKIILNSFFGVVHFYKETLSNVGTQKSDWIMKKHVIIVNCDARNPFPERWDCKSCVMVKPNQKQTKIICKQKHRVELNMTQ